jgi:hypothetical protein
MITIMSSLSNAHIVYYYTDIYIFGTRRKCCGYVHSTTQRRGRKQERERERGRERKPHAACRRNRDRPDEWRNETKRKNTPRSYTVAIERHRERHYCVNNTRLYIHTHPLSTRQAVELRMLLLPLLCFSLPHPSTPLTLLRSSTTMLYMSRGFTRCDMY